VWGRPRLPCIVRNLSSNGALLDLEIPAWLPDEFELRFEPGPERTGCTIRHRRDGCLGVEFCDLETLTRNRPAILNSVDEWMGVKS
jgi:hypothetical protein